MDSAPSFPVGSLVPGHKVCMNFDMNVKSDYDVGIVPFQLIRVPYRQRKVETLCN